ncbi:MAG: hypothetical protein QY309_03380 [Cyclobacteriaceae bacterium]|nr:MAG: hypothetical protein QY309_03380 [Cyclobacteriaceae bacterium]
MRAILFLIGLCFTFIANGQEQIKQTQFEIEGLRKMMLERIKQVSDLIDQNKYDEAKKSLSESFDRVNGVTLVYDIEVQKQINELQEKISKLHGQLGNKESEIKGLKDEVIGLKKSIETLTVVSKNAKEDQTKQIVEIMKLNSQQAVEYEKLKSTIEELKGANKKLVDVK